MALTIEDGTGIAGADSFVSLVEFDVYTVSYFNQAKTGTDAEKEGALRRAWLYLRSLCWLEDYPFPTLGGTIPEDVKIAQSILAAFEVDTPNGLQPSVVPGQQKILTRVGEIGWTATGSSGVDAQRLNVTMIEGLLSDYTSGSVVGGANSGTGFLTRA